MNSVDIKPMTNSVEVQPVLNIIEVSLFDVYMTSYYLTESMVLEEVGDVNEL